MATRSTDSNLNETTPNQSKQEDNQEEERNNDERQVFAESQVNLQTNGVVENKRATVQRPATVSRFLSVHFYGTIELGWFESVNDVYIKYSIVSGPDFILSSGQDIGITQIARRQFDKEIAEHKFVWNQPITLSYRCYNYYGWPQIVLSVYYFDTFGNDQILGYGCVHLPASNQISTGFKRLVKIYAPQSTSLVRQLLSWVSGKKPELVDSNLFARADCRSVLQMTHIGRVELTLNITTKDVATNGYRT